jgi:hypothetical protein
MATSQFIFYKSEDVGAPILNGTTGSLLNLLNQCLVNGYGTQPPAGWIKPFPDTASLPGPNCVGGFVMPSGSKCGMFINDAGASTALGAETSVTGWEQLLNPSGSTIGSFPTNVSKSVGGGIGQFPTPAQSLTTGRLVWRKSKGNDFEPRQWRILADPYTVYVFIQTGDTIGTYYCGTFGDIYSLAGRSDAFRCHIEGRSGDSSSAANLELFDTLNSGNFGGSSFVGQYSSQAVTVNHFMARPWFNQLQGAISMRVNKTADIGKVANYNSAVALPMAGIVPFIPTDGTIYVAHIYNNDTNNGGAIGPYIRGRWRGMYHVPHPINAFGDGQTFPGAGNYAGKTFMIFKSGPNAGFWAMETSATLETN